MKNLNSKEFEGVFKRNKRFLYVALGFLILTALFAYLAYQESQTKKPKPLNLEELISLNSSDEDIYAYLDITSSPLLFALYETDGMQEDFKYYLVKDANNFSYVIYGSNATIKDIKKQIEKEKSYHALGVTKKIPDDVKKILITSYNKNKPDDILTLENFQDFVGLIYLDMNIPLTNAHIYYFVASIALLITLITLSIYLLKKLKIIKTLKQFKPEELQKIVLELWNTNETNQMHFYLTKNYLIDLSSSIVILKYTDLIWAYPYEYRYNGLVVNKNIKLVSKNNHHYKVANTKKLPGNKEETLQNILNKLQEKNAKIILGYNKENKKKVQEMLKVTKSI